MKKILLVLCLAPSLLFAQTTVWEENFDSYTEYTGVRGPNSFVENNGYTPGAVSKWVMNASALELSSSSTDYFFVNVSSGNGELHARDIDGSAYLTTESINISSQTGDVSIKIGYINFNAFTTGNFSGSEYIDISYSTDDGASYTLIPFQDGSETTSGHTFADDGSEGVDFTTSLNYAFDPGAATSLIVKIRMYNNGSNERFELDDISVVRNSATLWSENFDSYSDNYGYVGIDALSPAQLNSGDYPSTVSKWTLSPSGDFKNQNDYAAVRNGILMFNDVDNAVTFETENIDITGVSNLTFSCDVSFGTSFEGDEYLDIYYSTDGGSSYQLEGSPHTYVTSTNVTEGTTVNFSKTLSGLTSTDFRIKIVAFSDSNVEDFEIDNIKVINNAPTGIDNVFSAEVKVYPNPLNNTKTLHIESPSSSQKQVDVYSIIGTKVFSTNTRHNSIDLSNLKNGTYVLHLEQDNKVAIKKIVIK